MSSTVSATPLAVEIRPSRWLSLYVLSAYAAAGLVVIILPVAPWFMCAILCVMSLSGVMIYRARVNLRSHRAVVALNRFADGSWQLRFADGITHQANLLPDSYLHPGLLVLNFKLGNGKRRSVVLVRDSADCNTLRRLRIALALGVHESRD